MKKIKTFQHKKFMITKNIQNCIKIFRVEMQIFFVMKSQWSFKKNGGIFMNFLRMDRQNHVDDDDDYEEKKFHFISFFHLLSCLLFLPQL